MPWNHRVIIPNVEKMYEDVCARGWEKEFTSFLMDSRNGEMPLSTWLAQKKLREADYEAWKLYEMDAGEAFVDRTSRQQEIDAFVKDAYGLPYVPGSSVKGMFRTALLVWEIQKKPEAFWQICQEIQMSAPRKAKRKDYLSRETQKLEQQILYTLSRDEKKLSSAVNDCLAGLHVGDSESISTDQLTLSQKIDYTLDGKQKPLPLLRESLIPGTEICFPLSIDTLYKKIGVSKKISSFTIPLGATINMGGAAITISVMALAAAHTLGISVDFPTALILCILAAASAAGASGVAGGSLLLIPMACSLFGIPNDVAMQVVGVGFIVGVIQDSCETALNSSSDVLLTATAEFMQWRKAGKEIPF